MKALSRSDRAAVIENMRYWHAQTFVGKGWFGPNTFDKQVEDCRKIIREFFAKKTIHVNRSVHSYVLKHTFERMRRRRLPAEKQDDKYYHTDHYVFEGSAIAAMVAEGFFVSKAMEVSGGKYFNASKIDFVKTDLRSHGIDPRSPGVYLS